MPKEKSVYAYNKDKIKNNVKELNGKIKQDIEKDKNKNTGNGKERYK